MEKTGCKIICGAPTTFAVKGLMVCVCVRFMFVHMCVHDCVVLILHTHLFSQRVVGMEMVLFFLIKERPEKISHKESRSHLDRFVSSVLQIPYLTKYFQGLESYCMVLFVE